MIKQHLDLGDAQRILVTGNAGSGKTWVATQLAARMGMPAIGLDLIVWRPGWLRTPIAERHQQESAIAAAPAWIVDGVSLSILDAADTVVFLDYSRPICCWRALRRNVRYLFHSRPGLPENCPEIRIVGTLLKIIWRFPHRIRPKILEACAGREKRLIHIRNNKDLARLLNSTEMASAQ